jgi:hypothetical protein
MVPRDTRVLTDLVHSVGNKLLVLARTKDPEQRDCTVQPTMEICCNDGLNRLLNIGDQVSGHVAGYQF